MARVVTTMMVYIDCVSIQNLFYLLPFAAHIAQAHIGEATLLAVQQHMAQQAAFSQVPDVVKGVSGSFLTVFCPNPWLVYCKVPPSSVGQQPSRDHCCI